MADTPQPQDTSSDSNKEPSIEEILGSIRQIISDETAKEDIEFSDEAEEEVLELTNKLDENTEENKEDTMAEEDTQDEDTQDDEEVDWDAALAEAEAGEEDTEEDSEPEPEPKPEPEPRDEISPDDINLADPEPEPTPQTTPQPSPSADQADQADQADKSQSDDDLLSAKAAEQAASAIGKLSRHMPVNRMSGQGVTIEDIVRQEIRPILRGWLDENLPDLVERLVREQLEKISRNA